MLKILQSSSTATDLRYPLLRRRSRHPLCLQQQDLRRRLALHRRGVHLHPLHAVERDDGV